MLQYDQLNNLGLALAALFYAAIGVKALARPSSLLSSFGITADGAAAKNEIRAVYGGFPLTVALLLAFSLFDRGLSPGIVVTLAACSAGMAVGRTTSAIIDRTLDRTPAIFLTLEIVVALAISLSMD